MHKNVVTKTELMQLHVENDLHEVANSIDLDQGWHRVYEA